MRMFGLEIKKLSKAAGNGSRFSDSDRERSKDIRRMSQEEKKIDHQIMMAEREEQLNDLRERLDDYNNARDEDEQPEGLNADTLMMSLLTKILTPQLGSGQVSSQTLPSSQPLSSISFTDEQLREFKGTIPKAFLKKAKKMSDDELIQYGRIYKPDLMNNADSETLKRALIILRE